MSSFGAFTLFSGSKGNSTLVFTSEACILIDAGVSARAVSNSLKSLGLSPDCVSDIFVTHDHTDHTRGLEGICAKHSVRVHMTKPSAEVILTDMTPQLKQSTLVYPIEYTASVGDLTISSFATTHDSRASVGYVIASPVHKLGYATDLGQITDTVREHLCGVDSIVLESNHDVTMLCEGSYPEFLKKRILSRHGHLSNDDAAAFAAYLAENGTENFLLAHLSEQNNDPEAAYCAVYSALGDIRARGITLAVAEPACATRLVLIGEKETR